MISTSVGEEIKAFIPTGRPIVLIALDAEPSQAVWWPLTAGLPLTHDTIKTQPEAADDVVKRIEDNYKFSKRNQRLRHAAVWMLVIFVALLSGSAFLAVSISNQRSQLAQLASENRLQTEENTTLKNEGQRLAEVNKGLETERATLQQQTKTLGEQRDAAEERAVLQTQLANFFRASRDSSEAGFEIFSTVNPQRPFQTSGNEIVIQDVYLPFDRYQLTTTDTANLADGLKRLAANGASLSVEGHVGRFCVTLVADVSGSDPQPFLASPDTPVSECRWWPTAEYGLALAERQAAALHDVARSAGLGDKVQTVSYGEERPRHGYPPNTGATAGEWNRQAQRNNRIAITVRSLK